MIGGERPDRVQHLFLMALELPRSERDDWLLQQCGNDSSMLEEVRSLLAHDACGDDPLEKGLDEALVDHPYATPNHNSLPRAISTSVPGEAATLHQSPVELSGARIGPYKLLQQLGEGGMGVVYMAEQKTPVERRVALKIIKPGMDSRQVIARFEAERQALAMMDHPNIARVLNAGETDDGRPYFVMELVKGKPITLYCDEQKLTPKERLELFVPVCHAVQHAHQKGIIHRDLKPSNVLVARYDEKAVPKVIDFGVAKAISTRLTDKTMFTQFGQLVGTIEYMSPEQATFNQLDIDTRTDIYSLGVLLYELLTGRTPLDRRRLRVAAFQEILRIIRDEEPPKPSVYLSSSDVLANVASNRDTDPRKLTLLMRGELDWVVMKALEKDRARRYETANGLAMDVERYLSDEPVTACPPSAFYRFGKAVRRHRVLVGSAVCVLVSLLIGLCGTFWFALEADKNSRLAERRAANERGQRVRAENAERLAQERLLKQTEETRRAELAVEKSIKARYELNTSIGLQAVESIEPGKALLWFAEAAKFAKPESHESMICRMRHLSWRECTPLLVNYFEHSGQFLKSLEYDPSGEFLATLTSTGQSRIWDVSNVADVIRLQESVVDQAWHPNRRVIALALEDQRVQIFEVDSGKILQEFEFDEPIGALAYDHTGSRLAVGGKSLRIWNVEDANFENRFHRQNAELLSVSFSADDSKILALYDDDRVRLLSTTSESVDPLLPPIVHYATGFPKRPILEPIFVDEDRGILTKAGTTAVWTDIASGSVRKTISMEGPNVTFLACSPDRRYFAITWQGEGYQIWDAINSNKIAEPSSHDGRYWGAAFSPDGLDLVVNRDAYVERIKSSDGELYGASSPRLTFLQQMQWSPNGRHVATVTLDGWVNIWDFCSYSPPTENMPGARNATMTTGRVRQIQIPGKGTRLKRSRSGKYILACGSNFIFGNLKRAMLFSASDGAIVDSANSNALLLDACISHDDSTLAIATLDNEIEIWSRGIAQSRRKLATVDSEPIRIEFGPAGKTLVVLQIDGRVTAYDTQSGKPRWSKFHLGVELPSFSRLKDSHMYQRENGFPFMQFQSYDLRFGSDGTFFVTNCANKYVCVWNVNDGNLRLPPISLASNEPALAVSLSPDSRFLAVGGTAGEVWDLATASKSAALDYIGGAASIVFDSDADRLAVFTGGGACYIYDRQSGSRICPGMAGYVGTFTGRAEEWLLTVTQRGARLWSTQTGRPVTPPWPLSSRIASVVPLNDSQTFFLSGEGAFTDSGKVIDVLSLKGLFQLGGLSSNDCQLQAEILIAKRVDDRSKLSKLPIRQWQDRVQGSMQPGKPVVDRWGNEEVISWHRNQQIRAIQDGNSYALRWHTKQLARVQGRSNDDLLSELARLFPEATKAAAETSEPLQENAGQPDERPYSNWLLPDMYQRTFESKDAAGFYPEEVEGTILGNRPIFRARFVPKPDKTRFGFRSFHGISEPEYRRRTESYEREGFRELSLHSFSDAAGDLRYSGTWVRE